MAILWCGGEDIDFPNGGGFAYRSSGTPFRSGYARAGCYSSGGAGPISTAFPGGAITSGWLSFQLFTIGSLYDYATNGRVLAGLVKDTSSNKGIYVGCPVTDGKKLAICTYDGSTVTVLASESGQSLAAQDTGYHINMKVESYGESATVTVYVGSNQVVTYSGDISVSGVSNLGAVCFRCDTSSGSGTAISEIIVSSTDTRNLSLVTLYPNEAGDTLDWTGAYTTVDELTIDDGDVAYDNTDGHQAMYGLSDLPSGTFSVLVVKESVRACMAEDATPTSLDIGIKSDSVDVNDNHELSTTWTTYERFMTQNPVTSAAFTPEEIDDLQLVLESEA